MKKEPTVEPRVVYLRTGQNASKAEWATEVGLGELGGETRLNTIRELTAATTYQPMLHPEATGDSLQEERSPTRTSHGTPGELDLGSAPLGNIPHVPVALARS